MNETEAIELIKNMLPEKVSYANLVGASNCYGDKYIYEDPEPYALELAISALEKQIPKKIDHDYLSCNSCDGDLEVFARMDIVHCPWCGQRLDWSVEE